MFEIYLPVANMVVNGLELIILGVAVGFLTGLSGIGGGFLTTPLLNIVFGIPMNVAIGSNLTQIVATSSSGAVAHKKMGHVELRLALLTLTGSIFGVLIGVTIINELRFMQSFDMIIKGIYVIILAIISTIMLMEWVTVIKKKVDERDTEKGIREEMGDVIRTVKEEVRQAVRERVNGSSEKIDVNGENVDGNTENVDVDGDSEKLKRNGVGCGDDKTIACDGIPRRIQNIGFMSVNLPHAKLRVPLFMPFLIGIGAGTMMGLMGVGGGFIMVPVFIYVLGIPTILAIGTSLFQMIFTASIGSIGHAMIGNVDLYLVILLLFGSTLGVQVGARLTEKVGAEKIRLLLFTIIALVTIRLMMDMLG